MEALLSSPKSLSFLDRENCRKNKINSNVGMCILNSIFMLKLKATSSDKNKRAKANCSAIKTVIGARSLATSYVNRERERDNYVADNRLSEVM